MGRRRGASRAAGLGRAVASGGVLDGVVTRSGIVVMVLGASRALVGIGSQSDGTG